MVRIEASKPQGKFGGQPLDFETIKKRATVLPDGTWVVEAPELQPKIVPAPKINIAADPDEWESYVRGWIMLRDNTDERLKVKFPLDEKQKNAALAILQGYPHLVPATEEDWSTEYLAPILAVKIVDGIDAAIEHINTYSSKHTDAIVTEDYTDAMRFLREVDSASVMINASTRFADGFEYGLGAEIGISNDKLHARGPVGLEGLTSLKYVVFGHGEIRE